MREERDKLAKEAAQLAATRAELETKKAETLAANSALKEAEHESELHSIGCDSSRKRREIGLAIGAVLVRAAAGAANTIPKMERAKAFWG